MKILSLDLSLNHTGVAVFRGKEFVKTRLIEPNEGKRKELMRGAERLDYILNDIESTVKEYASEVVVIEDVSFGSRGRATIDIGELHGIVKLFFYRKGIPVVLVPPKTLKKWVTGSGNADKNLMLLKCYKRWGEEFSDDDQCDAYCLAKYYLEVLANEDDKYKEKGNV